MKRIILTITIITLTLTAYSQKTARFISSEVSYSHYKNGKWSKWGESSEQSNVIVLTKNYIKVYDRGVEISYAAVRELPDMAEDTKDIKTISILTVAEDGEEVIATFMNIINKGELYLFLHKATSAKAYKIERR